MRPHPKDLDDAFLFEDLIDQAVLNINAAGVCAAQIPEELLERRRSAKRIFGEDAQELFRFRAETRRGETARIFLRVSPTRLFVTLIYRRCQSVDDGFPHAGYREEMQGFLHSFPVLFSDQDSIRARAGDEHRLMVAGRFIEKSIKLLAGLAGVHAVHTHKRTLFRTFEQALYPRLAARAMGVPGEASA
jgi:hypothetical protein